MRLRKSTAGIAILGIGLLLCAGNLWFTAARSTIPRSLDVKVADKSIGREKHRGIDDVYWLVTDAGEKIHVDAAVFRAVIPGERLQKEAWSRTLRHGRKTLLLEWSEDFRGMLWSMPAAAAVLTVLGLALRRRKEGEE